MFINETLLIFQSKGKWYFVSCTIFFVFISFHVLVFSTLDLHFLFK